LRAERKNVCLGERRLNCIQNANVTQEKHISIQNFVRAPLNRTRNEMRAAQYQIQRDNTQNTLFCNKWLHLSGKKKKRKNSSFTESTFPKEKLCK
jgi:hypothetical protein